MKTSIPLLWAFFVVLFVTLTIVLNVTGSKYDMGQDARLKKLEAASTGAQQPQERQLFDSLSGNTEWELFSSDTSMHVRSDGKWMNVSFTYRSK